MIRRIDINNGQKFNLLLHKWDLPNTVQILIILYFIFKEIDYIMITGDFPSHEVWKQSREWNLAHSKMMSDLVSDVFPDKLILPSVGNHESFPTNRFVIIITGVRPEDE